MNNSTQPQSSDTSEQPHTIGHYELSDNLRRQLLIAAESALVETLEDVVGQMIADNFNPILSSVLSDILSRHITKALQNLGGLRIVLKMNPTQESVNFNHVSAHEHSE